MKKISDFRPQEQNANKHTPRGLGMLRDSIQQGGWISAITTTADGESIDGSARLEEAYEIFGDVEPIIVRSKGDRPIIHIREDIPTADTEQARRLSIAANRVSEVSLNWDMEVLEEWSEDFDLSEFWADYDEINKQSDAITEEDDDAFNMKPPKEIQCVCPSCGQEFVKEL